VYDPNTRQIITDYEKTLVTFREISQRNEIDLYKEPVGPDEDEAEQLWIQNKGALFVKQNKWRLL